MGSPGVVVFPERGARVDVEIVEKPEEQRRGLSGRTELPENSGMVFWLGHRDYHAFWMGGCKIPLDLIHVDYGRVVGMISLSPGDQQTYKIDRPSSIVLEVNGGWAARHGVQVGDQVQISLA